MGNSFERQQSYIDDSNHRRLWQTNALRNERLNIQGESYILVNQIGRGDYGVVYSSITSNGHRAAIKTFDLTRFARIDPSIVAESFFREVRMSYKMRNETLHIVTIYGFDFDHKRGLALMAMELGGDSLEKKIQQLHLRKDHQFKGHADKDKDDYIPSRQRQYIWKQLVNIVETLHRHNVIHRDMTPNNLVFFGSILKLVDLGIAQKEMAGFDSAIGGAGTEFYSAPECFQYEANVTTKADVWSIGALLYYMTYGEPPRQWSSRSPSHRSHTRSIHVNDLLIRCLKKNPDERPSSSWLAKHPYTFQSLSL